MKVKAKKCKGNGKAIGFDGCGKFKESRKYGLCRMCFTTWLLNTPEGKEVLNKSIITSKRRVATARENQKRKEMQKMKENVTDYKKKLQTAINKITRLIDKGQPCLATGRTNYKMDAGHVYSRGANQSMRYNMHNIHRQSAQSNHYQSDDLKMREGLIREYGQGYADFVYQLKQTDVLKYSQQDYKIFYEKAKAIIKELEEKDRTYDIYDRIKLRNKYNSRIGIYRVNKSIYNTHI